MGRSYFRIGRADELDSFHREKESDASSGHSYQPTIINENHPFMDGQSAQAQHESAQGHNGVQI